MLGINQNPTSMKNLKLIIGISVFLFGCRNRTENLNVQHDLQLKEQVACMDMSMPVPPPPPAMEVTRFTPPFANDKTVSIMKMVYKQKIIRDALIDAEADDVNEARAVITRIVKSYKGYLDRDTYRKEYNTDRVHMLIRIPSENFDSFISGVDGLKLKIIKKEISSEDVTDDYYDTQTRINNQKKLELEYLELLKKAVKVSDVLEIEEKIEAVREIIETGEGKIKLMDDKVAYSMVTFELSTIEKIMPLEQKGYGELAWIALKDGWSRVEDGLLNILGYWHVYLMIIIATLFVYRKIRKRKAA